MIVTVRKHLKRVHDKAFGINLDTIWFVSGATTFDGFFWILSVACKYKQTVKNVSSFALKNVSKKILKKTSNHRKYSRFATYDIHDEIHT